MPAEFHAVTAGGIKAIRIKKNPERRVGNDGTYELLHFSVCGDAGAGCKDALALQQSCVPAGVDIAQADRTLAGRDERCSPRIGQAGGGNGRASLGVATVTNPKPTCSAAVAASRAAPNFPAELQIISAWPKVPLCALVRRPSGKLRNSPGSSQESLLSGLSPTNSGGMPAPFRRSLPT